MTFRTAITTAAMSILGLAICLAMLGAASSKPKKSGSDSADTIDSAEAAYQEGMAAVEHHDFEAAVKSFRKAHARRRSDADIMNMLAYSLRKTGEIEDAVAYYHKALRKRPEFPEAREYLGEAYLQGALDELKILKSYGEKGEHEYRELADAFKAAVAAIDSGEGSDGKKE